MKRPVLLLIAIAAGLATCAKTPCPVCYEDAWSREPFPGQQKQHIPPLSPEKIDRAPHSESAQPATVGQPAADDIPLGW